MLFYRLVAVRDSCGSVLAASADARRSFALGSRSSSVCDRCAVFKRRCRWGPGFKRNEARGCGTVGGRGKGPELELSTAAIPSCRDELPRGGYAYSSTGLPAVDLARSLCLIDDPSLTCAVVRGLAGRPMRSPTTVPTDTTAAVSGLSNCTDGRPELLRPLSFGVCLVPKGEGCRAAALRIAVESLRSSTDSTCSRSSSTTPPPPCTPRDASSAPPYVDGGISTAFATLSKSASWRYARSPGSYKIAASASSITPDEPRCRASSSMSAAMDRPILVASC